MSGTLSIRNRQRTRAVDKRLLHRILLYVLREEFRLDGFELCFHLVSATEMTGLNQHYLGHEGSTDVITFDHSESPQQSVEMLAQTRNGRKDISPVRPSPLNPLKGELFISIDDAVQQARRFRTTWQSELARYAIHGLLHLCGYDDHRLSRRRRMKHEENRILRTVKKAFALSQLQKTELGTVSVKKRAPVYPV